MFVFKLGNLSGLFTKQNGSFFGLPRRRFCPKGFDRTSEEISSTSHLYIRPTECLQRRALIPLSKNVYNKRINFIWYFSIEKYHLNILLLKDWLLLYTSLPSWQSYKKSEPDCSMMWQDQNLLSTLILNNIRYKINLKGFAPSYHLYSLLLTHTSLK